MSIYELLDIKTIINAGGTLTKLGGSIMAPEVLDTMKEASKFFIDMNELHCKAGKKIAQMLKTEAACITSGAAAGIAISAAACMTGTNISHILQLPETRGMKNEALVIKCHRTLYDQALLLTGVKMIEIGTTSFSCLEMIESAITDNTAFFFYASEAESMRGSLSIREISSILKKNNIPLIVDAAAEIPPKSNILKYLNEGADLVLFSGGKEIRGPQSSGVILGDKKLIQACNANCCPNHSIGRPMKIDKETIVGFTKAIELFVARDYDLEIKKWNLMVDTIISSLEGSKKISIKKGYPSEPGIQPVSIPRAYIKWNDKTATEVQQQLLDGTPSIYTGIESDFVAINPQCLKDVELETLISLLGKL